MDAAQQAQNHNGPQHPQAHDPEACKELSHDDIKLIVKLLNEEFADGTLAPPNASLVEPQDASIPYARPCTDCMKFHVFKVFFKVSASPDAFNPAEGYITQVGPGSKIFEDIPLSYVFWSSMMTAVGPSKVEQFSFQIQEVAPEPWGCAAEWKAPEGIGSQMIKFKCCFDKKQICQLKTSRFFHILPQTRQNLLLGVFFWNSWILLYFLSFNLRELIFVFKIKESKLSTVNGYNLMKLTRAIILPGPNKPPSWTSLGPLVLGNESSKNWEKI